MVLPIPGITITVNWRHEQGLVFFSRHGYHRVTPSIEDKSSGARALDSKSVLNVTVER